MDAVSRVDDAVALTAYVQALVARYVAADEAGETSPGHHPVLTQREQVACGALRPARRR